MSNDLILVLGVLIGALTFPAVISAFSASRPPRAAIIAFVTGGALVSWAVYDQPSTYSVENFPEVFVRVIKDLIR